MSREKRRKRRTKAQKNASWKRMQKVQGNRLDDGWVDLGWIDEDVENLRLELSKNVQAMINRQTAQFFFGDVHSECSDECTAWLTNGNGVEWL